ncbi:MAG: hypothetical protein E3J21_18260, partial [Anaerolineales bacterium]
PPPPPRPAPPRPPGPRPPRPHAETRNDGRRGKVGPRIPRFRTSAIPMPPYPHRSQGHGKEFRVFRISVPPRSRCPQTTQEPRARK